MNEYQRFQHCSYLTEKNPSALIRNIVMILNHRITKYDLDRHTEMLMNFIHLSREGFLIRDLAYIIQTIEVLSEIQDSDAIKQLTEEILLICSIPPLLTVSSDITTFASDMRELFSFLGCLLIKAKEDTKKTILMVTSNLLKIPAELKWSAPLEFRRSAAGDSMLPNILGQLLNGADELLYPDILPLILILTQNCSKSKVFIDSDALNILLRRMEPTWRERYPNIKPVESTISEKKIIHFENTFLVICSLLDHLEKYRDDLHGLKDIERFSLWNLRFAYQSFLQSKIEYISRNNATVLILRLMDLFPKAEFVVSGIAEDIASVNFTYTVYENGISSTISKLTSTSEEDYCYMKLILLSIPVIAKLEGGLTILEKERIIHRLLKIISRPGNPVQFSKAHACVIQIFCWDVLKKLVPFLEEEFIEYSGPHILLECMKLNNLKEEGLTILVKCLGATNYMLKFDPNKIIINSILYNDGIKILLTLCETFLTYRIFNDTIQQCLKKLFSALTVTCGFPKQDNSEVVPIALKYLKRFLYPNPEETVYDNRILIGLIDFIWEIIVKSEVLSTVFIKEGVYLLLDIVQAFPLPVQIITLGALVDLCEDERCIPYMITWSGRRRVKLLPLLMSVFRYESKQLQVKVDRRGRISDPKCPLMGKAQCNRTFNGQKEPNSNPSISDLFMSTRPKIYAILNLLNERHQEVVELANEQYKTFNDKLSAEDQMTMLLADNFLALKFGETWKEVEIEFDMIKFIPTQSDGKIISSLLLRAQKWGEHLKKTQSEILQQNYEDERVEEQKLYVRIGESCISEAIEAVQELKYIARCIERMFRISQKHKQQNQIERSLRKIVCNEFLHKTYISGVRATPVFNLSVSVQSNIINEDKEEAVKPVSPKESEVQFERKSQEKPRKSDDTAMLFMKLGATVY